MPRGMTTKICSAVFAALCLFGTLQAEEAKAYNNKEFGFQVRSKAPMKFSTDKLAGAKLDFFESRPDKDSAQGVVVLAGKGLTLEQAVKLLLQKQAHSSTPVPVEQGPYKGLEVEGVTSDGKPFLLQVFAAPSRFIGPVAMGVDLKENLQFVKSFRLNRGTPKIIKKPK